MAAAKPALSTDEIVAAGIVNPGWAASAWAERLDYVAGLCRERHPEYSDFLRRWAASVRQRHPDPKIVEYPARMFETVPGDDPPPPPVEPVKSSPPRRIY